jgi:DNA-binding MarR family transcriptional regulator
LELQRISEYISDYIIGISKIIHKRGHKIAKEYGLTYDQFHLLIYLNSSQNPPTINDIANKLDRAQNTVSEKITRLEEKGLIARRVDIDDRRITRVEITQKGSQLINKIEKEKNHKVILSALTHMEEEDVLNLLENLKKLYNCLKEVD